MARIALLVLFAVLPASASAQTAYVTDVLQLGLHAARDTSDVPFRRLSSGTELEVLERDNGFARVRTTDGAEGWVRAAFLVDEKPARLRMAEVEAALVIMREELSRAQAARQGAEADTEALRTNIASGELTAEAAQEALAQLERQLQFYETRMDETRGSMPLGWVVGAVVVAVLAGFLAGMWFLDVMIRRRHGGFRVY